MQKHEHTYEHHMWASQKRAWRESLAGEREVPHYVESAYAETHVWVRALNKKRGTLFPTLFPL